jgi:hypothetical protein
MTHMCEGSIIGGDTYSDYLALSQVDSYSTPLLAGSTYNFYVKSTTIPLGYALVGPVSVKQVAAWRT